MYKDYVPEKANFYVDEEQIDKILPKPINNNYVIVLILCLTFSLVFILNMWLNKTVVDIEENKGHPSFSFLLIFQIIAGIILSLLIYFSRKENRNNTLEQDLFLDCLGYGRLKCAFILYIFINILWSTVLFHSRINRGLSGFLAAVMMIIAIWLCICAYYYNHRTIVLSVIFLLWNAYMVLYTYSVSLSPWLLEE